MKHCNKCKINLGFDFTMAFQPIIDFKDKKIFGHEALIRGLKNEPASSILSLVDEDNRYCFDQKCRVKAVEMASKLDLRENLSINFLPNAVYHPRLCLETTLEAAEKNNFPLNHIIFEFTENEEIDYHIPLTAIIKEYRLQGLKTAFDDFGAGYCRLNLLADFQPDFIKLDIGLTHNVHMDRTRRMIVRAIANLCQELSITIIAEGIESYDEVIALRDFGINLFQGNFFAEPAFQTLATYNFIDASDNQFLRPNLS